MISPAGAHDPDEIVICEERKADTQHPYQGERKNPTSPASHIHAVSLLDPADNICSWGIFSCYHTECRHAMLCQASLVFLIFYKHHMVPHISSALYLQKEDIIWGIYGNVLNSKEVHEHSCLCFKGELSNKKDPLNWGRWFSTYFE